jgi:hypothetical protein
VTRAVVFSSVAALVVFAVVQDRVTVAGVGQYEIAYREAAAGKRGRVTIDEVMKPAVVHGVQQGALWGFAVFIAGVGGTAAARRLRGRE